MEQPKLASELMEEAPSELEELELVGGEEEIPKGKAGRPKRICGEEHVCPCLLHRTLRAVKADETIDATQRACFILSKEWGFTASEIGSLFRASASWAQKGISGVQKSIREIMETGPAQESGVQTSGSEAVERVPPEEKSKRPRVVQEEKRESPRVEEEESREMQDFMETLI